MKHLLLFLTMSVSLFVNGQISVLPYEQTFDDVTIPALWTQVDHQGDGDIWQFGTDESTSYVWPITPDLNGNYAILNSAAYGQDGQQNVDLISPSFDFSAYSSITLQFTHFFYYWSSPTAATLYYSIDNGTSWVEIKKWEDSSSNPETFNQVIAAVGGQSQVKFKWNYVGADDWGWAIDDVLVSEVSTVTWNGVLSNNWHDPINWSPAVVPGANNAVVISSIFNDPVIMQDPAAECLSLTIGSGSTVTINPGFSLSVYDELVNNTANGLVLKSDASGTGSLIAGSITGSGTAQIERYMEGNRWYYVGSPVEQPITDFLANNASIPTNSASRGMMDYDTESDSWNAFFTNSEDGDLGFGSGYSIRTSSNTHVTFNGPVTSGVTYAPRNNVGNRWNLIGNPYTSPIKLNYYAGTNNFLGANESVLEPNYVAIYYWNGTQYETVNYIQGPGFATVGQGFFVKSFSDEAGYIAFTPEMQIHQPTVPLKSGVIIPGIKLLASSATKNSSTDIKFFSEGTTGLDKGYDAGLFKADPSFSVFTKLVDDNNVNFAIQCLPTLSKQTMIVPVGIDFPNGGEVTFTAQLLSIPEKTSIVLEDRLLNTTTAFVDAESHYTTTIEANSMSTGRFYLHVTGNSQTTGISESVQNKINAWMETNEIVINGVTENNAVAKLFDIRGSSVLVKNLDKAVTNRINVNGITSGIYMLQVIEGGKRTGIKLQINGK